MPSAPSVDKLRECLLNIEEPIAKRTRAVFYLRTKGDLECVQILCNAIKNKLDSCLMRHEIGYVLGQIRNHAAVSDLLSILQDESDDSMVRHECAEALGAINAVEALPVLKQLINDPVPEVAETCQIAADLIEWNELQKSEAAAGAAGEGVLDRNPYYSVDPAPALPKTVSTEQLRSQLLDDTLPMFLRYRAMFSLRNRGREADVLALCAGLECGTALYRHEIAYVLGQMMHPASVPALSKVLRTNSEHRMVRHEAAEALGAVGTQEAEEVLREYEGDEQHVVRESCAVALDILDYWGDDAAGANGSTDDIAAGSGGGPVADESSSEAEDETIVKSWRGVKKASA